MGRRVSLRPYRARGESRFAFSVGRWLYVSVSATRPPYIEPWSWPPRTFVVTTWRLEINVVWWWRGKQWWTEISAFPRGLPWWRRWWAMTVRMDDAYR